jgi:biotin carboxyl carrier protein
METTLFSSITGIVTEVNVSAKEQVSADKVLIIVEKETV